MFSFEGILAALQQLQRNRKEEVAIAEEVLRSHSLQTADQPSQWEDRPQQAKNLAGDELNLNEKICIKSKGGFVGVEVQADLHSFHLWPRSQ